MLKRLVLAAVAVAVLNTAAAATSKEELEAELAALKRKEAAAAAEISTLRKKIRALESAPGARAGAPGNTPVSPAETAMAAEPSGLKAPRPAAAPLPSWAGLYIGAGYARNRTNISQGTATMSVTDAGTQVYSATESLDQKGYFDSAHILGGYLWQYNRFIAGVEGDYTLDGRTGSSEAPYFITGCTPSVPISGSFGCANVNALGSFETKGHLRAIAGVEITPRLMAFIAGGAAFAKANVGVHATAFNADSPGQPDFAAVNVSTGNKLLIGSSFGGGVQAKINESLIARVEYVHDRYSTEAPAAVTAAATATGSNVTMAAVTTPDKVKITNDAVRTSLIYRFDPEKSIYESAAHDIRAFFSAPPQRAAWAGFYAGGGINQNNYSMTLPNAATLTINDTTTPGTDFSRAWDLEKEGANSAQHLLVGYRFQFNRLLLGIERDWVRGSKHEFSESIAHGLFGGPGNPMTCYDVVAPSVVCIGNQLRGGGIETKGHLRYTIGLEITPSLMGFFSAGRAYASLPATRLGVGSSGVVYVPPNVPLVGAATVTRGYDAADITGRTIGGGAEFKLTENLTFRGEYYRDTYTWNLPQPIGGAGFGGTTGNVTVNSFNTTASNRLEFKNDVYRATITYRFFNPQDLFGWAF